MAMPAPSQDPQASQDPQVPEQPQEGREQEGQESPEQLADEIGAGLLKLQAMAQKAGGAVKPQELQLLNQAVQSFQQFYQSVSGEGNNDQAPTPGSGPVPLESGSADVRPVA